MTQFVGSYVEDVKLALKASVLAQEHCLLLSAPGWGKTEIALSAARKCVGDDFVFLRFAPSTPPQKVEGMFDPQAAISNPPRFVLVRDKTLFDPNAKIVILDEFGRPSDIVFDIILDGTDRRDIPLDQAPVAWGTSNFAPTSARTEALRERFALWKWVQPGVIDMGSIIRAHAHSMGNYLDAGDFPSWKEVLDVRSADPGDHAISVCDDMLTTLQQEAAKAGHDVNPRRAKQWFKILFRTNVYFSGKADFDHLTDEACKTLLWAWPNTDETKASEWSKIASCVVDIIGTALTELKSKTLDKVKSVMATTNNNTSRSKMMIDLGSIIQDGQREIETLGSDDTLVKKTLKELEEVLVKIARGEDPFA